MVVGKAIVNMIVSGGEPVITIELVPYIAAPLRL